jgi:putative flavoprotein involved in K+ transport
MYQPETEPTTELENVGTIVVGAGAAGLVMGHYLRRAGWPFLILESDSRIGDTWRRHWESLRLFSRPRYASLPGLQISTTDCPTSAEMAAYLEQYAEQQKLPVVTSVRVTRVHAQDGCFQVSTDRGDYRADRVVVASGAHRRPSRAGFSASIEPNIRQLHSLEYRRPQQLGPGGVLVVGAGNSGTDIALESARYGHPTWLSGRHPGQLPVELDSWQGRLGTPVVLFSAKHLVTLRTSRGRARAAEAVGHGDMLIRNRIEHLDAAGVRRVDRIAGIRNGLPIAEDGHVIDIATVVWCTGSVPDHSWIDLPAFDDAGRPRHWRGVSDVAGLYFLGLDFQFSLASSTIQGMDRDARYLMRRMRKESTKRATSTKSATTVA